MTQYTHPERGCDNCAHNSKESPCELHEGFVPDYPGQEVLRCTGHQTQCEQVLRIVRPEAFPLGVAPKQGD